MRSYTLRRRTFLQIAASTAASGAISCSRTESSPWRVLTLKEARTVQAIAARIVPADDAPGAADTGAVEFIDRQLDGILKKHQKAYRQGLIGIDHVSQGRFGKAFSDLEPARQDEILSALEAGSVDAGVWNPTQAKAFFELVRDNTMASFYGDPRHGGNREYASWRMLDVPVIPIRGRRIYDLTTGTADEDRRNKPWR